MARRMRRRRNPEEDQLPYGEWIPTEAVMFNEDGTVSLEVADEVVLSNRGRRILNWPQSKMRAVAKEFKRRGYYGNRSESEIIRDVLKPMSYTEWDRTLRSLGLS